MWKAVQQPAPIMWTNAPKNVMLKTVPSPAMLKNVFKLESSLVARNAIRYPY